MKRLLQENRIRFLRSGGNRASAAPQPLHQIDLAAFGNRFGQTGCNDAPVDGDRDPGINRALQLRMGTHKFAQHLAGRACVNCNHLLTPGQRPEAGPEVDLNHCP